MYVYYIFQVQWKHAMHTALPSACFHKLYSIYIYMCVYIVIYTYTHVPTYKHAHAYTYIHT